MTRPRRQRRKGIDRDPELIAALQTGAPCAYSLERWNRITGHVYFGDEPELPFTYGNELLDRWRPEYYQALTPSKV